VAFYSFDENYLKRLQDRDPETEAHFCAYFTPLLCAKLKKRGLIYQDVEDIRQDTFRTALGKIAAGEVRDAARLGAYIHGICTNLIHEHYRRSRVHETINEDGFDVPGTGPNPLQVIEVNEKIKRVRQVLAQMPGRDREILIAILIDERDRDEICREHDVDREYLRVLVHRGLKLFRDLYLKQ